MIELRIKEYYVVNVNGGKEILLKTDGGMIAKGVAESWQKEKYLEN